jgi:hypothetical protein
MLKFANAMVRVALTGLLTGSTLMALAATTAFAQQTAGASGSDASGKPSYNIVFLIVDQQTYRLLADYSLPTLDTIAHHGVAFKNHYISSAMCSTSRASFLTGQPPQVAGGHRSDGILIPEQP